MFERLHHRRVAEVLAALNADLLADNHCLFGGGTAIALRHGEYRETLHPGASRETHSDRT
ncbi:MULTISPECIES: hypothetical protein [unclassified Variovorax]|uniref:hypothetical protein n=1 Tax=unclassified Variovorax TaxID=663243 RepID=UPI003F48586D